MTVSHPIPGFSRRTLLAGIAPLLALPRDARAQPAVAVLADAGCAPALDKVAALHKEATGAAVTTRYGASIALVQQLQHGVPADVFISGAAAAMEFAIEHRLVRGDTRRPLAVNRLVLVAPKDSSLIEVLLAPGTRLSALAGPRRIAIDAEAASGGVAQAALERLGLWADAEPCLNRVETSRAAVALVGQGEASLGIALISDARLEPAVKVVGLFPETSHPPILYEAVLTITAGAGGAAMLEALQSPAARAVFESGGFLPPG